MNRLIIIVLFVVPLTFWARKNYENADNFVKVKKYNFTINGKPYYFLGTNMWYGANLGSLSEGGNQERLVKELDLLQSLGINNLRILGASEGVDQHNTVYPPIQPEPGKYNEEVLQGLDFLLAEMAERDMYAVIYLNNFWIWSGGMSQYVAWLNNEPVPNPFLEEYSWNHFMNYSASFYRHPKGIQIFNDYIKSIVCRINTVTGIEYKNDPTIMSWQLANEPRPGNGEEGQENFMLFSEWINQTAKYIKSLDSNHLVSIGSEGTHGCMESAELFKEIHRYKAIDYVTFHLWILNWGWFDPLKPQQTYITAEQKALAYIDDHINYTKDIGKPVVLEEFGIPRDAHSYLPEATTLYRNKYFNAIFQKIFDNASEGGPLAGSNFWSWGGYGRARNPEEAIWQRGDSFVGDPPQEPQGRNSVFAMDTTTIKILRKFAIKMKSL